MGIRPEDVHDEPRYLEEFKDCLVKADVEVTELMGAETYLYLNVEGFSYTARVGPPPPPVPATKVDIVLETRRSICSTRRPSAPSATEFPGEITDYPPAAFPRRAVFYQGGPEKG